jgi:hypothetical protein
MNVTRAFFFSLTSVQLQLPSSPSGGKHLSKSGGALQPMMIALQAREIPFLQPF